MTRTMSPATDAPRLLLVADPPDLGGRLRQLLHDAYAVTVRTDARGGFETGRDGDYDVLLVGTRLPDGDGADVVESLRGRGVTTPVLMVSPRRAAADAVRGLDAGADDYVSAPVAPDELLARLRAIRRSRTGGLARIRVGGWEFEPDSRLAHSPYAGRIVLTERETELLRVLASRPQRVFAREELMRRVFPGCGDIGAVATYVHYIRRKTDPEMITTVHGRGYRLGMP